MRHEKARLFKEFYRGQNCRTIRAETGLPRIAAAECRCVSRDGARKNLYGSLPEAQLNANHSRAKTGVKLRAYACPAGAGYHLTRGE